jgi:uncharacterized protein (TIGR03437 family)
LAVSWYNTFCANASGADGGGETSAGAVTIVANPTASGIFTLSTNTVYAPNAVYGNAQVTVTASGSLEPTSQIQLQISSVINGFSTGTNLAPGILANAFGPNLSGVTAANVNGIPVRFVIQSPTQIVFEVPQNTPLGPATLTFVSPSSSPSSASIAITISRYAPAIASLNSDHETLYALHADGSEVTSASPANVGETLTMFVTGLGAVTPPPTATIAVGVSSTGERMIPTSSVTLTSFFSDSSGPILDVYAVKFVLGASSPGQNLVSVAIAGIVSPPLSLPVRTAGCVVPGTPGPEFHQFDAPMFTTLPPPLLYAYPTQPWRRITASLSTSDTCRAQMQHLFWTQQLNMDAH